MEQHALTYRLGLYVRPGPGPCHPQRHADGAPWAARVTNAKRSMLH